MAKKATRGPGRPKSAPGERTIPVAFAIARDDRDRIDLAAAELGENRSEFLRTAGLERAERVLKKAGKAKG